MRAAVTHPPRRRRRRVHCLGKRVATIGTLKFLRFRECFADLLLICLSTFADGPGPMLMLEPRKMRFGDRLRGVTCDTVDLVI